MIIDINAITNCLHRFSNYGIFWWTIDTGEKCNGSLHNGGEKCISQGCPPSGATVGLYNVSLETFAKSMMEWDGQKTKK